jgi:hypothetical protein
VSFEPGAAGVPPYPSIPAAMPADPQIPSADPTWYAGYPPPPVYGAPGYPVFAPPPPKPSRSGLRAVLIVAAIVSFMCAIVACVGGFVAIDRVLTSSLRTPPPSVTGTASPDGPTGVPPLFGDLRDLLLRPPPGSQPLASPLSSDGTLTLDQASTSWTDPAWAQQTLPSLGFKAGAIVQWSDSSTGVIVDIRLLQLGSSADARTLTYDTIDGDKQDSSLDAIGTIDGIPDSELLVSHAQDQYGDYGILIAFFRNDISVLIEVVQTNRDTTASSGIAVAQYANLP